MQAVANQGRAQSPHLAHERFDSMPNSSSPSARRLQLDGYCAQAQSIILARQDPHTGLLPAGTAVTVHGDYAHAWVRDNVYSILAVWALALAYRRCRRGARPDRSKTAWPG